MSGDRLSNRQRVLVADDNPDLRQLWRGYLMLSGFDVSEAANGAEAVAKAVQDGAPRVPEVIVRVQAVPDVLGGDVR